MAKKTRIAYYVMVREGNMVRHQQYIYANELYLIATMFNAHPMATDIIIERCELSTDHWLFS